MAKMDATARQKLGTLLKERLPPHWTVGIGGPGVAFIEIDQDGTRPENRFPEPDSHVIVIGNGPGNQVDADLFVRVDCPPGYAEARQPVGTLSREGGRGWKERLAEDVTTAVMQIEASLTAGEPGEA